MSISNGFKIESVYGVDFSGAKLAGENIWIARLALSPSGSELIELSRLRTLCGAADRAAALAHLIQLIAESRQALWGMDFPFGLPIELLPAKSRWPDQLRLVSQWPDAYALGLECVRRARALGGPMHIRRTTDNEARTPFDCYHYRIIYQTYHGMRDVLAPLSRSPGTAILPFQYRRLSGAARVIVEACPGSTLKRLGLPHQNYKQPAGGALTTVRRETRHAILRGLDRLVHITSAHRRIIMRNGGGDALDAVIAAVGALDGWLAADHAAIARHSRYSLEGRLYF